MNWHYTANNKQTGPVSIQEIANLVAQGTITNATLLWKEGMSDWKSFQELKRSAHLFEGSDFAICSETDQILPKDQLVQLGQVYVSATHKDSYLQKIQEGTVTADAGDFEYAGFWIRFVAKFIDGAIVGIVNGVFVGLALVIMGMFFSSGLEDEASQAMVGGIFMLFAYLISFLIGSLYNVIFLPKYGATPGKMAVGLKVIEVGGSYISKGKAVGRFFGEMLCSLTFFIGYIMVAFDDEKRALHDHVCATRVVKK